jgi:SAM-dependent methyltransferase
MGFRDIISHQFLGKHFSREYLQVDRNVYSNPFEVVWLDDSGQRLFFAEAPLLLGFDPVFIGISSISLAQELPKHSCLSFQYSGKEISSLKLEKILESDFGATRFLLCRCVGAKQGLVGSATAALNNFRELFRKNHHNLSTLSNRYMQLCVSYSVPRPVVATVVNDGDHYNIFPGDLQGKINDDYYVHTFISGSLSSMQITSIKRAVICEMDAGFSTFIPKIAGNHNKELHPPGKFPFGTERSQQFQWFLPKHCERYFELELMNTFPQGFHTVFVFKILNQKKQGTHALAHIHRYTAEWRRAQGLKTEYLNDFIAGNTGDNTSRYYDAIAGTYDSILESKKENVQSRNEVAKYVQQHSSGRVLDFGGGTGLDLTWLAAHFSAVYFLEPSGNMRKKAQLRKDELKADKISILPEGQTDFHSWERTKPFKQKVDAVLANFAVLNNIGDPGNLFHALSKITTKQGQLFVVILNPETSTLRSSHPVRNFFSKIRGKTFSIKIKKDNTEQIVYLHSIRSIKQSASPFFKIAEMVVLTNREFLFLRFSKIAREG